MTGQTINFTAITGLYRGGGNYSHLPSVSQQAMTTFAIQTTVLVGTHQLLFHLLSAHIEALLHWLGVSLSCNMFLYSGHFHVEMPTNMMLSLFFSLHILVQKPLFQPPPGLDMDCHPLLPHPVVTACLLWKENTTDRNISEISDKDIFINQ